MTDTTAPTKSKRAAIQAALTNNREANAKAAARAAAARRANARADHQGKVLLLAALVRRFGTDDGKGGKVLTLTESELFDVPKGEALTATNGVALPDGTTAPGTTYRVFIEPAPEASPEVGA